MENYETIVKLCKIAREQADIIMRQAEIIEQAKIACSISCELSEKRATIIADIEAIEKNL